MHTERSGANANPEPAPRRQQSTLEKSTKPSSNNNLAPPPVRSNPPPEPKAKTQGDTLQVGDPKSNDKSGSKPISMRRNSWISNISSKFSSGSTPPSQQNGKGNQPAPKTTAASSPSTKPDLPNPFGAAYSPKDKEEEKKDENNPFVSSSPKGSSFLQNAFRKLSSGSGGLGKVPSNGVICERRVMNVDENRDRCKIPDLDQGKLRRVAFCVDVEVAGVSRRESEDEESQPSSTRRLFSEPSASKSKKISQKSKDKGEATALKAPEAAVADKEKHEHGDEKSAASSDSTKAADGEGKEPSRKQEKKKRSEEERRDRKEKKRRHAVANGSVPLQLNDDEEDNHPSQPVSSGAKTQSHPTTDPVRIYRRCCQLRESPVLKKVVDEISSPSSVLAESPGTVAVLELKNFPMTSQDIITFCDWLAVVPVRKLILENCGLTDDSVRAILSALLSTKTVEQMRHRRGRANKSKPKNPDSKERVSVVEKVSLKDNSQIGPEGWRYICLFIHLSKSLRAIDLSGIPFPKAPATKNASADAEKPHAAAISAIFAKCLAERFEGGRLEELLLSECKPSTDDVGNICNAAIDIGLRRFGLANNELTKEGLEHVVRYLKAGKCEGLDLGGNPIQNHLELISSALDKEHPLYALSLADCSLTPSVLYPLFQGLTRLSNLRFIDFSHNPGLFSTKPDALAIFRRFLPKMPSLKRIHLANVNLSAEHAIALAEVLPDSPSLCHLNILENSAISALASATDARSQEEACAVYASLMAAVRVSRTIIAVDIEVPSAENNEVVKALASQIVAYSLRNLERGAIAEEFTDLEDPFAREDVPVPEILQHIVGNGVGDEGYYEEDEPAPDEDYVIGGTGVVKALGVCLGAKDHHGGEMGGDQSAPPSGTTTPRHRKSRSLVTKRPRDMSKNLLGTARNIRTRIQSALVREDTAGNDTNYSQFCSFWIDVFSAGIFANIVSCVGRLQFLDFTLHRMIQRFEDEYPETRIFPAPLSVPETGSQNSGDGGNSPGAVDGSHANGNNADNENAIDDEDTDQYAIQLSRASSMTSLHSRAMTSEEGHVHRLGQHLRRDFLSPSIDQTDDDESPSLLDDAYIAALRGKLGRLQDEQERSDLGDKTFEELDSTVDDLWTTQRQDAETFEKFKQSQIAAQINSGRRSRPTTSEGKPSS